MTTLSDLPPVGVFFCVQRATFTLPAPFFRITIERHENDLHASRYAIYYDKPTAALTPLANIDATINSLFAQITAYLEQPQQLFDIDITSLKSTPFQHRVWQALRNIPCGTTLQYGQLAKQLQTSARAIGNACRANPLPIVIPCHRIVAVHNRGGYAGNQQPHYADIKQWLLKHEQAACRGQR